jgi:hypothetical protein
MRKSSVREIEEHINATNRQWNGGPRDAWQGMPVNWGDVDWSYGTVALNDIFVLEPASKRDAKRYAAFAKKTKSPFPAVIVIRVLGNGAEVADGAHRVAAATLLGHKSIKAYVGVLR